MGSKLKSISINLPFGLGGANIEINENQEKAAWALYVEFATRISGQELKPDMGSAREALNSLYSLFDTTRSVLHDAGPGAAKGPESVRPIAIQILNQGLRPFMVKWHTSLRDFEAEQTKEQPSQLGGENTGNIGESSWSERDAFYWELEILRQAMLQYIETLASIAGISHEADSE